MDSRPNAGEQQPMFRFVPPPPLPSMLLPFVPVPPYAAAAPPVLLSPFVPPIPLGLAPPHATAITCGPAVQVTPITAANLDVQMDVIGSLLPLFPFVAVDTEYPGTVHLPAARWRDGQLTPDERYGLAKANIDELHVVQLGVTLCDAQGRLPAFPVVDGSGRRRVELAWEVNFSDFDPRRGDRHAADSVAFLRSQGIDFDLARAHGVSSAAFRDRLAGVLLANRRHILTWTVFGGIYDLGYLVKILTGGAPLPATKELFMAEVRDRLGGRVFDAKYMVEHCGRGDLRGVGLKRVARNLGVPMHYPEPPYLAGPKSILACRIFTAMRRSVFHVDGGAGQEGLVDGLQ